MSWTGPPEIEERLERLWSSGKILSARLGAEALFPLRLPLTGPAARELGSRFDEVRAWIRSLEEGSRTSRGHGYEIEWEEKNHRAVGRNRLPRAVVLPTELDALRILHRVRDGERFDQLTAATDAALPELRPWLARRPLVALEQANEWSRILAVVQWFRAHPRPGIYLRQVDVPGVDTKFIEARRGLFAQLLDLMLPESAIDPVHSGATGFEARYGLRTKPPLIRLRILDPRRRIAGLSDLGITKDELVGLELPVTRVFITENEVNGLAFPEVEDAIVIFGLGYRLEHLGELAWFRSRQLSYWGDIDTHGFAMLSRLRGLFPAVTSFLMDRETLLAHREQWVTEDVPHLATVPNLAPEERALLEDLQANRLGVQVRLEQERVAFSRVRALLGAL